MKLSCVGVALAVFAGIGSISAFCADWNKQRAADYLDSRQKAWFEWRATKKDPGGPCLSCHTGLTYLQARPALRMALQEKTPSAYETGLREAIRNRLDHEKPGRMFPSFVKEPLATQAAAVESVVSAYALAIGSGSIESALDRMLLTQSKEGNSRGGWQWFQLGESPWEAAESGFFGASLAAKALDLAPAAYRERPDVREHIAGLESYLKREFDSQPLHHRLFLLWASSGIGNAVPLAARQQTIDEALRKQKQDGSWTIESLGPWKSHANASDSAEGDSYATSIATLALQRIKTNRSDSAIRRGIAWLRSRQDPATGAWLAKSMNKKYPPDSMEAQFMTEAATAYAVMALLEAGNH
jgi:squalene-hopene/tetraprenyl-beta-curcumene cyclase